MCGITGIYAHNELGQYHMINLSAATDSMEQRGPDSRGIYTHDHVGLGHRRLSIIDTSYKGHQPMTEASGQYTLVFNGEIYNYKELRQPLEAAGISFESETDTEVLLQLLIREGTDCLPRLNGFFTFAFYNKADGSLLLARDRMGIKPMLYYQDEDKLLFGSELKAIMAFGIQKELDHHSLWQYLQFNYVPGTSSMLRGVQKLAPGHSMLIKGREVSVSKWYEIPYPQTESKLSYTDQQKELVRLLEESVARRLVADVPLGSFLSGGIDSSVIATLASRHTSKLKTFSIGYRDEPYFDETRYAELVAQKNGTDHQVFKLSNDDLFQELYNILDYIDEPFADSSAIPVSILSKRTRAHATVALSGDGADELFSGYFKHQAYFRALYPGAQEKLALAGAPLWKVLPRSRNNPLGNLIRRLDRFAQTAQHTPDERYWRWAQYATDDRALSWLHPGVRAQLSHDTAEQRKQVLLQPLRGLDQAMNAMLKTDMQLVLVSDMLTKVDLMSMMRSLEVRVPFLDHELVNYVFSLPERSKINTEMMKRILQDAFRHILPKELYQRPKKGFEVPLLKWFRTGLRSLIEEELLSDRFVEEQGVFEPSAIAALRQQLFSRNPGDAHAHIWALIVFQYWWRKHFA